MCSGSVSIKYVGFRHIASANILELSETVHVSVHQSLVTVLTHSGHDDRI